MTSILAGLLALTACTGDGPDPAQGLVIGSSAAAPPHVVTGEVAGRTAARLDVVSGATTVTVRAAELGDELFRASTPAGSQIAPGVVVEGDAVRVSLRGTGAQGPSDLVVEINAAVAWTVRLDGGATQETVDVRGGRLVALDVGAGVTRLDVTLPPPTGTVPIRMTGGASTVDVRAPADAAVRARFTGGAGSAVFDGETRSGVPGGTVLTTARWDAVADRYDLDLAGMSTMTLTRA